MKRIPLRRYLIHGASELTPDPYRRQFVQTSRLKVRSLLTHPAPRPHLVFLSLLPRRCNFPQPGTRHPNLIPVLAGMGHFVSENTEMTRENHRAALKT